MAEPRDDSARLLRESLIAKGVCFLNKPKVRNRTSSVSLPQPCFSNASQ
jgi:hypothetical protein